MEHESWKEPYSAWLLILRKDCEVQGSTGKQSLAMKPGVLPRTQAYRSVAVGRKCSETGTKLDCALDSPIA